MIRSGRGWGKTRTGAEWVRKKALAHPGCRVAIVARTYSDARDVCIEGESGLLSVVHPSLVATWNRSLGELVFTNGSRVKLFTAEKPDSMRGPQHHFAWVDELAAWEPDPEAAWDQLMFTLRLGAYPQVVVTTTPRGTPFIRKLLDIPGTIVTSGATFENEANLAGPALEQLKARYEGTRLGRQELLGEILEDVEGALWTRQLIEECIADECPDLKRIVVAVDPTGGSAECGIVVAGVSKDGRGWVLADLSVSGASPAEWGKRAVDAYQEWGADKIVVERNFGGDMAEHTVRTAGRNVPVKMLTASRGKIPRAEPVAALYEQGKVFHVGRFSKLEDQMCTYTPDDKTSPDRMDALVWALTELMVSGRTVPAVSPGGVSGVSSW